MPSVVHVKELRAELLAMKRFFVSQKDLLQLQDGFLALHSEWSAVQSGGEMESKHHVQVLRDEGFQVCGKRFLTAQKTSRHFRTISLLDVVSGPHYDLASTSF